MTEATPANRARAAVGLDEAPPGEPGTSLTLAQRIDGRVAVMKQFEEQFALAMPRGLEARQLIRDAATAMRNIPALADATQASFLGALMTAAQLGLRPNVPALGHGWVLPYENRRAGTVEAQWILGYQGMIELVERTGKVLSIKAQTIYSNEKFRIVDGLDEKLEHERIFKHDERGEPILHYAIARFTNGGVAWHVMGEDDVELIKKSSKSSNSVYSPWNTNRDAMSRKSAVRQLFKFLPKTTDLALAFASDEAVRTDMSLDALGADGDDERQSVTITRADLPGTTVGNGETITIVEEPVTVTEGNDTPLTAPGPYPSTALRKGLIKAAIDKHGDGAFDAAVEVAGGRIWPDSIANDTPGRNAGLAYLSTEQLRAVVAFDLTAHFARLAEQEEAERDALTESQLAADDGETLL